MYNDCPKTSWVQIKVINENPVWELWCTVAIYNVEVKSHIYHVTCSFILQYKCTAYLSDLNK